MRKILLYAVLLFTAATSFAQQTEPAPQLSPAKSYLRKSKIQKTAAWVLLSGGIVDLGYTAVYAAVATAAEGVSNFVGVLAGAPPQHEKRSYAVPIVAGLAAIAGSIPLFSAGAKNKERAMDASAYLKTERYPALRSTGITNNTYPSVAVRIKL